MQDREVAEKVTEPLFDVAEKLYTSVNMIDACAQEGKVSQEEADAYRTNVLSSLDELLQAIIGPIYEIHPELSPTCCCCGESEESEEGQQP
ncbi:hypothetical protein [Candidatus Pantoea persica]|uniref:hypothetical protein n=1 Tax=Candidatus Pantoea persica TaxID=2518128 RepID=UPI00215D99E0|nr:hypothetical protein [Candidatus Pantoea persica]MBA2817029.1 hypothetical protein [Candidatus Pantoea persica]